MGRASHGHVPHEVYISLGVYLIGVHLLRLLDFSIWGLGEKVLIPHHIGIHCEGPWRGKQQNKPGSVVHKFTHVSRRNL